MKDGTADGQRAEERAARRIEQQYASVARPDEERPMVACDRERGDVAADREEVALAAGHIDDLDLTRVRLVVASRDRHVHARRGGRRERTEPGAASGQQRAAHHERQ